MRAVRLGAAAFILVSGSAMAQDAPVRLRCEGKSLTSDSHIEPFSIEINDKFVTLDGVDSFESKFSLIQKDTKFYVFKNGPKTQGGNIDRTNGAVYLYAVNKAARKVSRSISGLCSKAD